jgi:hypothetical protein
MENTYQHQEPTVLTDEQTALVAGGLVIGNPILGGGCRTCTSGLPILFQTEAANFAK